MAFCFRLKSNIEIEASYNILKYSANDNLECATIAPVYKSSDLTLYFAVSGHFTKLESKGLRSTLKVCSVIPWPILL